VSSSDLMRDGHRKALPPGKRTSATGHTYYEYKRNHSDKGKVGDLYLAEGGSLNSYNVIYSTKSGRTMVAKNIMATNKAEAEAKLKKEMRASNTFDKVVMVHESFAKGGAIPNNYEGKTANQVWDIWTPNQREHFLADHYDVMDGKDLGAKNKSFKALNFLTQSQLELHIEQGQYANGGGVWSEEQRLAVAKLDTDFEKEVKEKGIDRNSKDAHYLWRSGGFQERMGKIFNKEYANGGMMNNMSVHEGTNFFNTPVYARGGSVDEVYDVDINYKQIEGYLGRFPMTEKTMEKLSEAFYFMYFDLYDTTDKKPMTYIQVSKIIIDSMKEKGLYENGGFMDGVYNKGGAVKFVEDFSIGDGIQVSQDKTKDGKTFYTAFVTSYPFRKVIPMNEDKKYVVNRAKKIYSDMLEYKKNEKFADGGDFMSGAYAEEGAEIDNWEKYQIQDKNGYVSYFDNKNYAEKFLKENEGSTIVKWDDDEVSYTRNKDGIRVKSVAKPEKELTEKEWMAKHNESPEARSYASGGDINANQLDLGYAYNFEKDEDNLGSLSKEGGVYFVLGFENGKHFSESFEKFADAKKFYLSKKNSFAFGGATQGNFTSYTGTNYTGLVGETNAMSSGELFEDGGGVGQKKYNLKFNVGKAKYVINSYDGVKKHKDGSEFYDIDIFKTKKDFDDYQKKLIKEGYKYSYEDGGDLFQNYNEQPEELAQIVNFYMEKFDEGDYDYEDSKNFLKEVEAVGYTFDYGLDNEPYGLRPIGTELNEYAEGGAIMQNQELIQSATMNPARMFANEGVYNRGGALKNERRYLNHNQDYEVRYARKHPNRHGYGNIKYDGGGEFSQYGKFISSQIEHLISLKTIASKKEPIQNLLKNMDDYRGTEIEKRITTDNLKYALQQKTVSKMNEVLRISLNALKD